jgi:hypothetical protein
MSKILSRGFIILTLITIISLVNKAKANLRKESILNEQMFSLELKCVIPMLGQSISVFQIDKQGTVINISDWKKTLDEYGLPDNIETNPINLKYINIVYLQDQSKIGVFWEDKSGNINLNIPDNKYTEIMAPCSIWMRDIIKLSNVYKLAQPSELDEAEKKIGNKKLTFDDTQEKVIYSYIFQDDNLKAITQKRGGDILTNFVAFVNSYRTLNKDEFKVIPPGIKYQDE